MNDPARLTGRRAARRHAFHLVFGMSFRNGIKVEDLAEAKALYFDFLAGDTGDDFEKLKKPMGSHGKYVDRAAWGVFDRLNQLDSVVENFLRDWTIDRISKVDLAIMRLAIYEMLCEPDVPLGAAVNEAVDLAKIYGGDESPAFINGVLGNVAREIKSKGRDPGVINE